MGPHECGTDADWRTSTLSFSNGNCVEAASLRPGVLVRDTKDRAGAVLAFGPGAWRAFTARVRER